MSNKSPIRDPIRAGIRALEPSGITKVTALGLGDPGILPLWFGETDLVTNGDFLVEFFRKRTSDARVILVDVNGHPTNAPKHEWFGTPWDGTREAANYLPADANNYFSLGEFNANDAGQFRRQKTLFRALHGFVLDDIGTKVPMELKVGDKILYAKYAGNEFKIDEIEYLIVSEKDVLAVVGANGKSKK